MANRVVANRAGANRAGDPRRSVLTARGWVLLGIGIVSVVAARLFAVPEVAVLGATAITLVVAAGVYQVIVRPASRVSRELHPPRVYAGAASRIDLQVDNRGRRTTPVLGLRDPVSGTRGANLLVQPLRPGSSTRAAYQLPTSRRGVLTVGPLDVSVTDPFGLTSRSNQAVEAVHLTVFPHIDRIAPVPLASGHDPMSGADHPNALGRTGEDFYALRPYVVGDDLRRVHWRSSARTDDLLVRQDELPWHGRTTVLIDVRRRSHTESSFEAAVSAAASIVMSSTQRDDLVRLATTDGWESTTSSGLAHADHILEHLANLEPTTDAALGDAIDRIARSSSGGALVLLAAELASADREPVVGLRRRFGSFHLVTFGLRDRHIQSGHIQSGHIQSGHIHIGPGDDFARAWNDAVQPKRVAHRPVPAPTAHVRASR